MKIVPQNDMIACICTTSREKTTSTGFVYKSNDIPLYEVEGIGPRVKMPLAVGDLITANSTGTSAVVDGVEYFLFKEENIVGKVEG